MSERRQMIEKLLHEYESDRGRAADLRRRLEAEVSSEQPPTLTLPRNLNLEKPPRQEHYTLEFRSYAVVEDGHRHNGLFDPQDPVWHRRSERTFGRI